HDRDPTVLDTRTHRARHHPARFAPTVDNAPFQNHESRRRQTYDARVSSVELRRVEIHGHELAYRIGGEGPVLLLVHGMAGRSATWRAVMPTLAERFTVIAPDLVGHGQSEKPRGDYSLGAFATGLRDLLLALGHERATLVGQSLGGGVVMQFAYQ